MAEVSYSNQLDGLKLTADDIYPYFYRTNGVNSLSMINGRLNAANLRHMTGIDYNLIQQKAQSSGGIVAGTRNLDYFGGVSDVIQGWYRGVDDAEDATKERWIPIPGASIQFRLDYPSYVLLTWHLQWTSDTEADDDAPPTGGAQIRLFIDGKPADASLPAGQDSPQVRAAGRTLWQRASGTNRYLRDRYKNRFWCGHEWIENKAKGWHSASLRVCVNQDTKQTRVRARSMKYIAFKRGDT
tara:strand:+ start:1273 stop:1995 length:723 start_codon:yes stop_codon:yes gene_type:complete